MSSISRILEIPEFPMTLMSLMTEELYANVIDLFSNTSVAVQDKLELSNARVQLDPGFLHLHGGDQVTVTKNRYEEWRQALPVLRSGKGMW